MKKLFFKFLTIGALAASFVACEKDQITPLDTQTATVEYTVLVVDGGASFKSVDGLEGISVTVSSAGKSQTKTTSASGQAAFTGLAPGAIAVTVEGTGFLTANFIADITPTPDGSGGYEYDNIKTRSAATKVVLIPNTTAQMATVTGVIEMDDSDTATTLSLASNVNVIARITGFGTTLVTSNGADGDVPGDVDIDGTIVSVPTDANGVYTLTLPAYLGQVTYEIAPQTFEADYYDAVEDAMVREIYDVTAGSVTVTPGGTYSLDFVMN